MSQFRSAGIVAAIAVAFAVASWLWPSQREVSAIFAVLCAVVAGSTALLEWPKGLAFIKLRSRHLVIAGWAVCVVGFAGGIALSIVASLGFLPASDLYIYAGLTLAGLGFMTARIPSMLTQVAKSHAAVAASTTSVSTRPEFNGLREGLDAPLSVMRGGRAFLQIAGPWTAVLAGAAFFILLSSEDVRHAAASPQWFVLGGLLLVIVAIYLIIPTVIVAWIRWIVCGCLPSRFIALPDRAVVSLAWRIWISLTFLGGVERFLTPTITRVAIAAMPRYASTIDGWTGWIVEILAIMLASTVALRLPAVAVRDTDFRGAVAAPAARKMWPGLPLGLVASLAAYPIAAWACLYVYGRMIPEQPAHATTASVLTVDLVGLIWLVVLLLAMFATLASAATFLSRAYLAAKARNGGAAS